MVQKIPWRVAAIMVAALLALSGAYALRLERQKVDGWEINIWRADPRPKEPRKADPRNKFPGFAEIFAADRLAQRRSQGSWDTMVHSLAYDENHHRLIVGRETGEIDIWNLAGSSKLATAKAEDGFRAENLAFDADGQRFFAAVLGRRRGINLWDAATGRLLHAFPEFSGRVFYTGLEDLYLMSNYYELYFFDTHLFRTTRIPGNHDEWAEVLAVDEKKAVAAAYMNGSLGLYRISAEGERPALEKLGESVPYKVEDGIGLAYFDPEGENLYLVLNRPGRLVQWSAPGLEKIKTTPLGFEVVTQAKVSPDKKLLALCGLFEKPDPSGWRYVVKLMELSSGRNAVESTNSTAIAIEFVPDLNALLAVHGNATTVFELP